MTLRTPTPGRRGGLAAPLALLLMLVVVLLAPERPVAAVPQEDVQIEVVQFGVGSAFRPSDMTGIRIELTSSLPEPTGIWVQWEVPNVDGDVAAYGRARTMNPGPNRPFWLYAPLPPAADRSTVYTIRVFAQRDGVRAEELGGRRIDASMAQGQPLASIAGRVAVVGARDLGLFGYQSFLPGMTRPVGANEQTMITSNLTVDDLPDRWFGWQPFEAVIWAGADESPGALGLNRGEALRHYVQRGGHLVIVLPALQDIWGIRDGDRGAHELSELLPVPAKRDGIIKEDVDDLRVLLPVLSKAKVPDPDIDPRKLQFTTSMYSFGRVGEERGFAPPYEPLIALPDGRIVAIERTYGHGRVTVVGIDVANGQLAALGNLLRTGVLPQADIFWNRVLGRRSDTPTPTEAAAIQDDERAAWGPNPRRHDLGQGRLFAQQIGMSQAASIGLLLALVLFLVYWVVAGPGGFFLLKQYKQVRHSWLLFAASAGVFTAVAWGAVSLLPSTPHQVRHVTILDHIARAPGAERADDPQLQRGISYFSAYLDNYGESTVALEPLAGQRDLVHSWAPIGVKEQRFPNVDQYQVDLERGAHEVTLPARSTATQLTARWLGALDPEWGSMITAVEPVRVVADPTVPTIGLRLEGKLMHSLPGTLEDVLVIWVTSSRIPDRRYQPSGDKRQPWIANLDSGRMLNRAYAFSPLPLAPDTAYPLSSLVQRDTTARSRDYLLEETIRKRYTDQYKEAVTLTGSPTISSQDRRNFMEMLSLYQQLTPPVYLRTSAGGNAETVQSFSRETGREMDLSVWLTRPCLIVMGTLRESPLPIPLRLDGSDTVPTSDGLTMVRWIHPLPLDDARAFPPPDIGANPEGATP